MRYGECVTDTGVLAGRGWGLMRDEGGGARRGSARAANRYSKRCRRARGSSPQQRPHQPDRRGQRVRAGAASETSQRRQHCIAAAHGQTRGCVPSVAPPRRGGPTVLPATAPPACFLTDSTSHTSERRPPRPRGHTPAWVSHSNGEPPTRPQPRLQGPTRHVRQPSTPETAAPKRQTRQRISCRHTQGSPRGDGPLGQP